MIVSNLMDIEQKVKNQLNIARFCVFRSEKEKGITCVTTRDNDEKELQMFIASITQETVDYVIRFPSLPTLPDSDEVDRTILLEDSRKLLTKAFKKNICINDESNSGTKDTQSGVKEDEADILNILPAAKYEGDLWEEVGLDSIAAVTMYSTLLKKYPNARIEDITSSKRIEEVIEKVKKSDEKKKVKTQEIQNRKAFDEKYEIVSLIKHSNPSEVSSAIAANFYKHSEIDRWFEQYSYEGIYGAVDKVTHHALATGKNISFLVTNRTTGNIVAANIASDMSLQLDFQEIPSQQRPAIAIIYRAGHDTFVKLVEEGKRCIEGLLVFVDECKSVTEKLEILQRMDEELCRRAQEQLFDCICTVNTNPVTQMVAKIRGYDMVESLDIRNAEYDGRTYFKSPLVRSDYRVKAYLKTFCH